VDRRSEGISSLKTSNGWDDVTGVGSVTAAYFSRVSAAGGRH
jgi:hypothetical protein